MRRRVERSVDIPSARLRRAVRVQHSAGDVTVAGDGDRYRVGDEFGAHVISDRLSDHPSGPGVNLDRHTDATSTCAVLSDVFDPQPVGGVGAKPAMRGIIQTPIGRAGAGAASDASMASEAVRSMLTHEPLDSFVVHLTIQYVP